MGIMDSATETTWNELGEKWIETGKTFGNPSRIAYLESAIRSFTKILDEKVAGERHDREAAAALLRA